MHKGYRQLEIELNEAAKVVGIGGIYAHYKSPDSRYRVLGLVVTEADDEIAVRYASLSNPGVEFIRPLSSWLGSIDGSPRFRQIK